MLRLILIIVLSNSSFASDDAEREKILNKYGSKAQYDSVINTQRDEQIKRKLKSIRIRLKEPLIENPEQFKTMNELEKERYLDQRKRKREELSGYLLKHHHLLEKEEQEVIEANEKKRQLIEKNTTAKSIELDQIDKMIEEYKKDFQQDDLEKKIEEIKLDPNMMTKLLGEKSKLKATQMLKGNPLSKMSREQIKAVIMERTAGSFLNKWLRKNPKAFEVAIEVAKDEKALPSLISIMNRPDQMKKYGIGAIFLFVVAFLLNLKNSDMGLGKKILIKLGVMFVTMGANLYLFYYLFKKELTPALDAIFRVL